MFGAGVRVLIGETNLVFLFQEACAEQMTRTGLCTEIDPLSTLFCTARPLAPLSRAVPSSPPPGSIVACPHWLPLGCPLFWSSLSLWIPRYHYFLVTGTFDGAGSSLPRDIESLSRRPHTGPLQRSSQTPLRPS